MKFTYSWLAAHLETDASPETIAEKLTAIGLEVESVSLLGEALAPFTVAHVIEAKPHPNADTLTLCLVDTGTERLEVVCGAPNARAGMKGVFAPVGTTIPGTGAALRKANIRGVESRGMLCSEREMGLGDDHEGIIELADDAPIGAPFARVMGLDDPVFDIAITPNRADCLGVHGIARDLAAAGLGRLRRAGIEPVPGAFQSPIGVNLAFSGRGRSPCPLFLGRHVRGVRNGESPQWLKDRLNAIGLRPISALVDLTNFLTIDHNRPVHVFDAGKVAGDLWLKLGCGGARLLALNGKEYTLDDEMTAIGDQTGVLSLAGIMGGAASGCTMETTDVFIEIALFDPVRTAATGRKLNLESDARYRFERGVDPAFAAPGMELATRLVIELCGGKPSEVVVAGAVPSRQPEIAFRPSRVAALGGVDVEGGGAVNILSALGFACEERDTDRVAVRPPSWRTDVDGEADLVEEVLRITGFDRIPAVSLSRPPTLSHDEKKSRSLQRDFAAYFRYIWPLESDLERLNAARRALAARGMFEAVTWSFMPRRQAALFGSAGDALVLANPINAELDVMRPSILPNLIDACRRNADRGMPDTALFETGPQYADTGPAGQHMVVAGVRAAAAVPRNWLGPERPVDPFDAKADALAVLGAAGVSRTSPQTRAEGPAWYHPGRVGTLVLGHNRLAAFGELHPGVLQALGAAGPMVGFEVMMDALWRAKPKATRARPPLETSDYPAVKRDFAFILDDKVPVAEVERAARDADKALIKKVTVFDVHAGAGIEAGKKSLAIAVRLESGERTLTDPEIDAAAARIVANVAKLTGGVLRG